MRLHRGTSVRNIDTPGLVLFTPFFLLFLFSFITRGCPSISEPRNTVTLGAGFNRLSGRVERALKRKAGNFDSAYAPPFPRLRNRACKQILPRPPREPSLPGDLGSLFLPRKPPSAVRLSRIHEERWSLSAAGAGSQVKPRYLKVFQKFQLTRSTC